eukprot:1543663-Rhodomonas_salina.1
MVLGSGFGGCSQHQHGRLPHPRTAHTKERDIPARRTHTQEKRKKRRRKKNVKRRTVSGGAPVDHVPLAVDHLDHILGARCPWRDLHVPPMRRSRATRCAGH